MLLSDELKQRRDKYQECLNHIVNTANQLSKAIHFLSLSISIQKDCYVIDDYVAESNYLNSLLEREKKIYSFIVNEMIPGLQSTMNDLNIRIIESQFNE